MLANLRESAMNYTRPDECSAEEDVFRSAPLVMQIAEYSTIGTLGVFQCLSSLFMSCCRELHLTFRCFVGVN